jgi:hypothetical protein
VSWSDGLVQSQDDNRRRHRATERPPAEERLPATREERHPVRVCPWCGSTDTVHVQRGFVGPTDDRNQYFTCNACDRLTYEIISKTVRDMRVGQFRAGGIYRDSARQTKYTITRVLKVGVNESLLYVKPIARHDPDAARSHH